MINSQVEFLSQFGWDGFYESQLPNNEKENLIPARVIGEERNLYRIQFDLTGQSLAMISGKMQFTAKSRADYPAVGDWVLIQKQFQTDRAIIQSITKRKTLMLRKKIGSGSDVQILSANVDLVFVTVASDNINVRLLERYLTIVLDSGAKPIILLTKADVCLHEIFNITSLLQREFPEIDIHAVSKDTFETADFLQKTLTQGTTAVVIGPSGVGKSTLVNFLIGKNAIKTQGVQAWDGKGRHTTTARSLYVSIYGGLIIDTPGMRELQLSDHSEGLTLHFNDIEDLIFRCRFSDCQHQIEPGCQIIQALDSGSLQNERWRSYQHMISEITHQNRKQKKHKVKRENKKRNSLEKIQLDEYVRLFSTHDVKANN